MNSQTKVISRASRQLLGATVGIPPRQVNFDFANNSKYSELPRYFYANNVTATMFFAVLSSFFPPGEAYFVNSVKHYRQQLHNKTLLAKVAGFIGQESFHGREHDRFNQLLSSRGFNMHIPGRAIQLGLKILEKLPASQQLACTTFMEHFTALLAEQLLTDGEFSKQADPELIKLWQWHAMEELEHKSVAYDVYNTIGNSLLQRRLSVVVVPVVLIPAFLTSWVWLIAREGQAFNWSQHKQALELLFGRKGFVSGILPQIPLFAKKRFHPAQQDTQQLEAIWQEKLFGNQGVLAESLQPH